MEWYDTHAEIRDLVLLVLTPFLRHGRGILGVGQKDKISTDKRAVSQTQKKQMTCSKQMYRH